MKRKFFNTTLANVLLGLILGIVLQHFYGIAAQWLALLSAISVVVLLLSHWWGKFLFSWSCLLTSIAIGCLTHFTHDESNQKTHYTKLLKSNEKYLLSGNIQRIINSNTAEVLLHSADSIRISGRVALSFQQDTLQAHIVGKNILFYSQLTPISSRKNPYQMDYKGYMQRQNIFWQGRALAFSLEESEHYSWKVWEQKLQHFFIEKLEEYPFSGQSKGIIMALLLGNRTQISPETYQNYIDAGAVHILAISGLHIGIITMIISYLLNFILPHQRHKASKVILLIGFLGGYALLTGLSASVLRASVMFGFLSIGQILKKRQGHFDNLLLSAFVLLLLQPFFLFEVGFQLSFMAVVSIIAFEPMVSQLAPKQKILRLIYDILAVSFTAQVGVLPISLYYFHQFPALFFLTNLMILPFLSFILGLGILVILLASGGVLPLWLAVFYGKIIELMNSIIGFVAHFESFVLKNIYFDTPLLLLSCTCISLLWWGFYHKKQMLLLGGFACILSTQSYLFHLKHQWHNTHSVWVFYQYNRSVIFSQSGRNGYFINTDAATIPLKTIGFLQQRHQLSSISHLQLGNIWAFQDKTFLIIDKPFYFETPTQIDYLLLRGNVAFHLEKFLQQCQPKQIITDGSSANHLVKKWEKVAREKNIPFHNGYEKGYWVINL